MQTQAVDIYVKRYHQLALAIKDELAREYQNSQISTDQLMVFLDIFKNAQNYWELKLFVAVFEDQFKFLKQINVLVREYQKDDIQKLLKQKLNVLLQTEPEKMVEITKFAAQPNIQLAELLEKYPDLAK